MNYLKNNFWRVYFRILFWFSLICVTVATLNLPGLKTPTLEITLLVYGLLLVAVALKWWKPSFVAAVPLRNLLQFGGIGLFYVTRRHAQWQWLFNILPGTAFLKQLTLAVFVIAIIFLFAYLLKVAVDEFQSKPVRSEA